MNEDFVTILGTIHGPIDTIGELHILFNTHVLLLAQPRNSRSRTIGMGIDRDERSKTAQMDEDVANEGY